MMSDPSQDPARQQRSEIDAVERALDRARECGDASSDTMLPLLYQSLRAIAVRRLSQEVSGHTLDATALIHEAYLRLTRGRDQWESERHFLGAAAKAMRDILVDHARRKKAAKRGGGVAHQPFDEVMEAVASPDANILEVADAVDLLEEEDPRKAEIVKLRYFVGLTVEETAGVLGVSVGTVEREWRYLKVWLKSRF